jgi:hypothetical protein
VFDRAIKKISSRYKKKDEENAKKEHDKDIDKKILKMLVDVFERHIETLTALGLALTKEEIELLESRKTK